MEKSYKIDKKEGNGISAPGMGDRSMLDLHSRFFADVHVRVRSAQKNRSNQKNFIYPEFLMVKKRAIFGKIPQINSQKNFYD